MAGQWRMDKKSFAAVWAANLKAESDWTSFCINLWARFKDENLARKNMKGEAAFTIDDNLKGIRKDTELQFAFISEKAAAKCVKLRAEQKKAGFAEPELPTGFSERHGAKKVKTSPSDINDIFGG